VMQNDLHHRELVEVGIEQALNDHGAARWCPGSACGRLSRAASACAYDPFPVRPTTRSAPPRQSRFTPATSIRADDKTRLSEGDTSMNKDTVEGNWKQLKGKVKEQWGKLTDDDLDVIAGKRDQLLGRIQERHGISREEAEKQVLDWETRDGRTPAALWFEKY
jgi:uncharacterized protein YjbJ (UPF0337 family)